MPMWATVVLTIFYVVWLCGVLLLLFVIWRSTVTHMHKMERVYIESVVKQVLAEIHDNA